MKPALTAEAKSIMSTEVVTLRFDATLLEAWNLFSQRKISGAPVVGARGDLVGVISQHDLVRSIVSQGEPSLDDRAFYYALPTVSESFIPSQDNLHEALQGPVESVMNPYVLSVAPTDSISSVATVMRTHHVHRVVVAEKGKIVGIITTFDLLKFIEKENS